MGEKRTIENTSAVILTLFSQYFVDLEFWFGEFSKYLTDRAYTLVY